MDRSIAQIIHDPEEERKILHAVVQDLPMPEGLRMAGQVLFAGLRLIYKSYTRGHISSADASRERIGLEKECRYFAFRDDLAFEFERKIRATEEARQAYRKERTLENADRLLAALEGDVKTKRSEKTHGNS